MRVARNLLILLALAALIISCATSPKARYYENLDMYDFVMTKFRAEYEASTALEQQTMDRQVLPLLDAWKSARLVWKDSMNDATKERAAMLAWSKARTALITFGIVTVEEVK